MNIEPQILSEELKTKTLLLIAQRLIKSESPIDIYNSGKMETAIHYAVTECKREIGQMMIEVLEMNIDDIKYETITGSNG